jgi:hypothetical protein
MNVPVAGPLFVTITVKLIVAPGVGVALSTVFAMARSTSVDGVAEPTCTEELAVLLPVFVSVRVVDSPIVATFVIVPTVSDAFTSAAISRVAVAFGARVPIVHVPVELA